MVGDVVSEEAWKRCVCETYGHTTARAKRPDTTECSTEVIVCFSCHLGQHSTCKVLGRGAGLANARRAGGRVSIFLCGVEPVYRWKAAFT